MHGLQSIVSTHSEESDSLLFILCLQEQMLLTSAFSKENSAISSEKCVLVFKTERADQLAKTGSKQLQPTSTSTYQEAKTLLRNRQKCQWKRASGDCNPSTDPINRLARHEQTTIFRLRTGHWPASAPEANWHHGLCTLRLQRS